MAEAASMTDTAWSVEDDWDKFPVILPYLLRNNPLSIAIKSNDVKTAEALINNGGVGINGIIGDYPWPIHMAVQDNNKDACRLLLRYNCEVNRGDNEGETPLHLATTDTVAMDIFEDLLAAGASVNQQNNMQETPLHFAALLNEMEKLKRLLQEPQLNVHLCDCKGNRALHSLIMLSLDELEVASEDLIEGIQLLMERIIDIDAQNKEGYTALMYSAFAKHIGCSIFLLKEGANPYLQDQEGNSFLHHSASLFMSPGDPVRDKYFLDVLETCIDCHIQPSHLLNVKNLQGDTPFLLAVKSCSIHVVEKCIEYGADVDVQNNLGWSCLFEAILVGTDSEEKVDLLLKRGAELNLTNVKGESVLHWGYDVDILRAVLKNKGDCLVNLKDSNGLTPLHHWVFSDRTEDVDILVQYGADVNIRDDFGSTPLHFAVWHCSSTVSKFLETKGADPFLEDAMGHRPCDVADVNQCNRPACPLFPALAEAIKNESFTARSLSDTDIDEDDVDVPDPTASQESFISKAIDKEDAKTSVPELLNSSVYGMVQWEDEALQIKQAVICLLEKMLVIIKGLDERFAATLLNTGSSSEGTLISQPHEFDFICYLDNFSSICTAHDSYRQIDGYCQAKLKDIEHYELYSEFFEGNRMLDPELVRVKMKTLFTIAFHQGQPWKDTRLYFEEMLDLADKPTINATLRWVGCRYKNLEISVDIVPALYFPGYWPSLIDTGSLTLLTEDINKAGCALLLQNANFSDDFLDNENTYLRISAAPAEVALFRTLPPSVKRSYALAKIMLQPDICPPRHYEGEWSVLPAGVYVSSYMLKTSLMYVLGEQPDLLESAYSQCASNDYLFVKELTIKIFRYLHTRTCCRSLNPYFLNVLENTDIFSFEYKEFRANSSYDFSFGVETQHERRKYLIELIIQILDRLVNCSTT